MFSPLGVTWRAQDIGLRNLEKILRSGKGAIMSSIFVHCKNVQLLNPRYAKSTLRNQLN